MKRKKILVFIATYNEKLNISVLFHRIIKLSSDYDVLIIDDNSNDGTKEILEDLDSEFENLCVINRPKKMGVGSAHRAAMIFASKNAYEKLVTMDADLSHSPDTIPIMLEKLKSSDFVIGSRYMVGGRSDYSGYRKWVSIVANQIARLILGIKIHECTTSFRAFRVSLFNKLNLSIIKSNGYSFFLECVNEINSIDAKIFEIPIHFRDRYRGNSKIPKTEILRSMYKLIKLYFSKYNKKQIDLINPIKIKDTCYFCSSNCIVEVNHSNSNHENLSAEAYNCTSIDHKYKPQVVNCLVCDLSFVPESSYPKDIELVYSEVEDFTYIENSASRYKTFQNSLGKISSHFRDNGNLLEVGSYCGFFLDVFKKNYPNWNYVGVEPSKWASDYARKKLKLNSLTGTLEENIKYLSSNYDAVVAWDVLEHLNDPLGFLNNVNSVMKKDGILCFSTLDIDSWFPSLMGKNWPWLMEMHLFYYDSFTTEKLLNKAGFNLIESKKYVHFVSIQYLLRKVISILPSRFSKFINIFKYVIPQKVMLPISFGDIKLYICRKQ